jgi:transcriptional regulator with XRE-family HTH domain
MYSADDAQQFGRTMREYRRRRGLTQQQLADGANVDRATVSLIENGREEPRADTVRRLASVLDVNPADFWREPGVTGAPTTNDRPDALAESSELHYESETISHPHPGLAELLGDERSRLMLAITSDEEAMLRSIRTRSDSPLGKNFFIDVLISYRRHRTEG